jgi:ketopantoate reductase
MRILIIGSGAMGSTIALAAALASEAVTVLCRSESGAQRCKERISAES